MDMNPTDTAHIAENRLQIEELWNRFMEQSTKNGEIDRAWTIFGTAETFAINQTNKMGQQTFDYMADWVKVNNNQKKEMLGFEDPGRTEINSVLYSSNSGSIDSTANLDELWRTQPQGWGSVDEALRAADNAANPPLNAQVGGAAVAQTQTVARTQTNGAANPGLARTQVRGG